MSRPAIHGHTWRHLKHSGASPEYMAWRSIVSRCYNPNVPKYRLWGGRGITVCAEWRHDFSAFLRDVGPKPGPGYSIDRIDNDGNYEPGNVRWTDIHTQNRNRRALPKRDPITGQWLRGLVC